jgi:hypothetical protein
MVSINMMASSKRPIPLRWILKSIDRLSVDVVAIIMCTLDIPYDLRLGSPHNYYTIICCHWAAICVILWKTSTLLFYGLRVGLW